MKKDAGLKADDTVSPLVFGHWPTPLDRTPRLAAALGLGPDDLWMKRDDLIGLGGGGNKVRKLQYTCAQALAAGGDDPDHHRCCAEQPRPADRRRGGQARPRLRARPA